MMYPKEFPPAPLNAKITYSGKTCATCGIREKRECLTVDAIRLGDTMLFVSDNQCMACHEEQLGEKK